jgi:hypothetical protein
MPCMGLERLLACDHTRTGEARVAQWVRGGGFILTRVDGVHIEGNPVAWEEEALTHFKNERARERAVEILSHETTHTIGESP